MKNHELLKFVLDHIHTKPIADNVVIYTTQHRNGYCICIRKGTLTTCCGILPPHLEYSLPATFNVWGIQSKSKIKETIDRFFGFYSYLLKTN